MGTTVKVDGLVELRDHLKKMGGDAPAKLHEVLKAVSGVWQREARERTPIKTGAARKTIRVVFAADRGTLTGGSKAVRYFKWLDYGGAVGRKKSVKRPVVRGGRIIYPAFHAGYDEAMGLLNAGIRDLARESGLEVTGSG